MTDNVEPTAQRIVGLDVARSLAIFGMVFVNFRLVMGAEAETKLGTMFATMFDGRAAALFVVLAGVGVSLMSRRARAMGAIRPTRITLLKRSLLLFIVGLLYSPIWPPDILHFYGVYLFAVAWLLNLSDRGLLAAAAAAIIVADGMLVTLDYTIGWKDFESLEYVDFWTPAGFIRNTFFNGFHPFFPWVGFVLYGMWLGRRRLDCSLNCWRFVAAFGLLALVTELGSDYLIEIATESGEISAEDADALFGTAMMPPSALYMISAASTATVVIGLCCRMGAAFGDSMWLAPLIATGQLALSHYVAHVLIGMGTLYMLGMMESQSVAQAIVATVIFCALATLFSQQWRQRFKRGPLEAVFRIVSGS